MLLVVSGCSFPFAASVVVGFELVSKPMVGLVVEVGTQLMVPAVFELVVCLAHFAALLGWRQRC